MVCTRPRGAAESGLRASRSSACRAVELQALAMADDGYHGHYHLTDKETLMKQSAAENRAARAAGIDPLMVQGDGGLKEKARFLNHADDC